MLINNPWGESNERGLLAADVDNDDVEIVGVEKFENNDVDMIPQLTRHKDQGSGRPRARHQRSRPARR